MKKACVHCGLTTSRYGAREGQVPHDRCPSHGAVRTVSLATMAILAPPACGMGQPTSQGLGEPLRLAYETPGALAGALSR